MNLSVGAGEQEGLRSAERGMNENTTCPRRARLWDSLAWLYYCWEACSFPLEGLIEELALCVSPSQLRESGQARPSGLAACSRTQRAGAMACTHTHRHTQIHTLTQTSPHPQHCALHTDD
ncbi:hypothetical protein KUDE01_004576 [Dissostichus eleginoides]|uniref:Uncharacterized protein n=1 Tax=Dissostichus eleginoides TaxID=100907 RepID=A0AAD9FK24_DISEL|nr:hypothetical protein KUDE01_004576 [Dissostichus eleginoides]